MQRDRESIVFVKGVNFEFIASLKNNSTKKLFILDNFCGVKCTSNAFFDFASEGKLGGWSTFYIRHYTSKSVS